MSRKKEPTTKTKRIRFSGYSKKESEAIHDRAEQVARALVTPMKSAQKKKKAKV